MTCVHLQKLYKLCQEHDLKLGGSDLIRVFCHQCGEQEELPPRQLRDPGRDRVERAVQPRQGVGEMLLGRTPGLHERFLIKR